LGTASNAVLSRSPRRGGSAIMRPMSVPARLVLASTSRYRRELLARMGLPVEAVAPGVEEDLPPGLPVVRAAALLAER
jgi:septum formation protein